jgi:hypothetical protein
VIGLVVFCLAASLYGPLLYDEFTYQSRAAKNREEAAPILRAVYSHKKAAGLWPGTLAELVPDFQAEQPSADWNYELGGGGDERPPILWRANSAHSQLRYYFPSRDHPLFPPGVRCGWVLYREGQESYLGSDGP